MSNTFGKLFRLTSFGESHGVAVGGVIDGCPAGIAVDTDFIQQELNRRRPGQSVITTSRKESDKVEFLSGVFQGKTTGQPIGFLVRNEQQRSADYEHLKDVYRPSHADFTYQMKYGIRDYRGGGRSSARETIARVVAGAFAKLALKQMGVKIVAYTSQIGDVRLAEKQAFAEHDIESNIVRCPDASVAEKMIRLIEQVRSEGDSIGGVVSCVVRNVPVGIGEPVFDKLSARLAYAMLSINAAKGFDYGIGFSGVGNKGSEQNDAFLINEDDGNVTTLTNNSGGIQGGLSNGADIRFRVLFKPTATISKKQSTVTIAGENVELEARGRHDPCVVPRAVPIVEAMAAMTVLDLILIAQKDSLNER